MNRYRVCLKYHTYGHPRGERIAYIYALSGFDAIEIAREQLRQSKRHIHEYDVEVALISGC